MRFGSTADMPGRGFTINLSASGLAIATNSLPKLGGHLYLEFVVGPRGACRADGQIMWAQRGLGAAGTIGVRLARADEEYYQFIWKLGSERVNSNPGGDPRTTSSPGRNNSIPPPPPRNNSIPPPPPLRRADSIPPPPEPKRTVLIIPPPPGTIPAGYAEAPAPPIVPRTPASPPPPAEVADEVTSPLAVEPLSPPEPVEAAPEAVAPPPPPEPEMRASPEAEAPPSPRLKVDREEGVPRDEDFEVPDWWVSPDDTMAAETEETPGDFMAPPHAPRAQRLNARLPIQFGVGVMLDREGTTVNLSETGLAVSVPPPAEPGDLAVFSINANGGTSRGAGWVVWVREVASDPPETYVGVRLVQGDTRYRQLLETIGRDQPEAAG